MPDTPKVVAAQPSPASPLAREPAAATTAAPRTPPKVPGMETPPEAPLGTVRQRTKSTGSRRLNAPQAVAQVSAAAAASDPVTSQRPKAPWDRPIMPPASAAPPLASTWSASRRVPLASTHAGIRGSASREIALEETKKTARTRAPAQPVPASTAPPTAQAASPPVPLSVRARQAIQANAAATPTAGNQDMGRKCPERRLGPQADWLHSLAPAKFCAVATVTSTPVSSESAVQAVIPLSLLEAMRNLDTPIDDGLSELAEYMVAKRLGLSHTVAVQIERYREASTRDDAIPLEEVVSVFRLVNRRPDAELVYADAGRRTARYAARAAPVSLRAMLKATPGGLRRRLGVRAAARIARRVLGAEFVPAAHGVLAEARLDESLATRAGALGPGCYFYGAAFAELLRLLSGFEGAMLHERCRAAGDPGCSWRATTVEGYE